MKYDRICMKLRKILFKFKETIMFKIDIKQIWKIIIT